MRVLLLLALVGAAFAAAPRSDKRMPTRIVGGDATTIEQHPYMANMQYHLWGIWWMQWCGGTLLTSSSVVSAAHCYIGDHPTQWTVRLGSSMASSGGSVHPVSHLTLHAGYDDRTIDNDIAIVRLATPAIFSPSVAAVYIASQEYIMADGTPVTAIGWGALSSGGGSPEQLQHVEVHTVNQQLCYQRYLTRPTMPDVTDNMLCAGIIDVGGKDACQGDSGGPLIHHGAQPVLVGVTSWGWGCADAFLPGVYARVSQYTDWIVANGSS